MTAIPEVARRGIIAAGGSESFISDDQIRSLLSEALSTRTTKERVLVLVPDRTRTMPLRRLLPLLIEVLDAATSIDVMVALGTHPPLTPGALDEHLGAFLGRDRGRQVSVHNHAWSDPGQLIQVGLISETSIREIAGAYWHESLARDVPVRINRKAVESDRIIILGPVTPHEVAGFSGGAKYLFPGIGGPEFIDVSHWLGALVGIDATIGIRDTPTRAMIEAAADLVPVPIDLVAVVVDDKGDVAGLFPGSRDDAWRAAVELAAQLHITRLDRPMQPVTSCAPAMYDELWTAGKAVYKLLPATAEGGEIIVYSPELDTVSNALGRTIYEVGYHVLPYFLSQWDRFQDVPLAVLAHSTHVKGSGTFERGVERPRIKVSLATKISEEDCRRLNLGYVDPASIDPQRPPAGFEVIPRAGETLYRLR